MGRSGAAPLLFKEFEVCCDRKITRGCGFGAKVGVGTKFRALASKK
jgi:hypothetical protein